MLKFVFIAAFLFHATTSGLHQSFSPFGKPAKSKKSTKKASGSSPWLSTLGVKKNLPDSLLEVLKEHDIALDEIVVVLTERDLADLEFPVSTYPDLQFKIQLQESWLDDVDGPKFLRGAEEEIQEDNEELGVINDFPNDLKRVAPDDVTATSIICDVAAAPQGIKTTKWNKNNTPTQATQHACQPNPTMVELGQPDDGDALIPSIVLLHRCVGECLGKHKLQNCTVLEQEEVMFRVIDTKNTKTPLKDITVYNHTKCVCACRTRKSDCDAKKHDYSNDTCKCECKQALSNSCNTSIQTFNDKTCQCDCNSAPKHCDSSSNEEWNPNICDCDCKQRIKDRCHRKGKVLNKSKCECECPKASQPCPPGTAFVKFNCTCVDTSMGAK